MRNWKSGVLVAHADLLIFRDTDFLLFFHTAQECSWKPRRTSLMRRRIPWAGLCVLEWSYTWCSAHPVFAVTTPTQEAALAQDGHQRGPWVHSELWKPSWTEWVAQGSAKQCPKHRRHRSGSSPLALMPGRGVLFRQESSREGMGPKGLDCKLIGIKYSLSAE